MAKKKKAPVKKPVAGKPAIKKAVKDFLVDEDGFVSKETILKVGLATVAGIGLLGSTTSLACTHTNHANHHNAAPGHTDAGLGCFLLDHSNYKSHNNHCSY